MSDLMRDVPALRERSTRMNLRDKKDGGDENTDLMSLLNTDYIFNFVWYAINLVICLVLARILKSVFGRKRPYKPDYQNPELN